MLLRSWFISTAESCLRKRDSTESGVQCRSTYKWHTHSLFSLSEGTKWKAPGGVSSVNPAPHAGIDRTSERRCHSRRWRIAIWLWAAGPAWLTRQPAPSARRLRPCSSGEKYDFLHTSQSVEVAAKFEACCVMLVQHADSSKHTEANAPHCCHDRYLALGNDRNEFFELTTPLFVSSEGVYSLTVPGYKVIFIVLIAVTGTNLSTSVLFGEPPLSQPL